MNVMRGVGITLILLSVAIAAWILGPAVWAEVSYASSVSRGTGPVPQPTPTDRTASIVIPKINADAPLVWDVDATDSRTYQRALSRGVAHARGTVRPGQPGNSFLFAHSSADLMTATRYNSVFYLIHKLESGDRITIWRDGTPYIYEVTGKRIVPPTETGVLSPQSDGYRLTLMTCWPPGTDISRMIVTARMLQPGVRPAAQ